MSTIASIRKRRKELEKQLKKLDGQRNVLNAQLKALRLECDHPNLKEGSYTDYGGFSNNYRQCPDCGLDEEN